MSPVVCGSHSFTEGLIALFTGAISAAFVGIAALIHRHRPIADRGVIILTALVVANAVAAMTFRSAHLWVVVGDRRGGNGARRIRLAVLVARKHVEPHPLPRLAMAIVEVLCVLGVIMWQRVHAFI